MGTDTQLTFFIVLAVVLLFIIVFSAIKGLLRMVFLALAISCAIVVWMFVQSEGFTLLSCITATPHPWMVQVLAWGLALFTLLLFFHGMTWVSQLFSPSKKAPGVFSIITTCLVCVLMMWVGTIAVSYYGTISRVSYYHDLAESQYHGAEKPEVPFFTRAKYTIRQTEGLSWLESIDPLESAAQSNLACLVAYGCSLNEAEYTRFYETKLVKLGVPHSRRFLELFADAGLRKLVAEGRFVSLLENDRLNAFLHYNGTAKKLENIEWLL